MSSVVRWLGGSMFGWLVLGCGAPTAPAPTAEPAPKVVVERKAPVAPKATEQPLRPSASRIYPLATLPKKAIGTPGGKVEAWIMDDDSKRAEGLMFLEDDEIKPNEGMLFVFDDESPRSFWMENTLVPLDIVYLAADGRVDSVRQGKVRDETPLPSDGPAKYVLELKKGRAAALGIRKGVRLTLPKG